MATQKTTAQFILDARKIHGQKYDYSKVRYQKTQIKVSIICPKHGMFRQTPNSHLSGQGCRKCATEAARLRDTKSTKQFIEEARKVHGRKYDYSKAEYVGARKNISIVCKKHGLFQQIAGVHLSGAGCRKCAVEINSQRQRFTSSRFIRAARERFGRKYDYSRVRYTTMWGKIEIGCPKHGWFKMAPVTHLHSKTGCTKCSRQSRYPRASYSTEEFIRNARRVHGRIYDYSKVRCKNSSKSVKIICPKHGAFMQTPTKHLGGKICPKCSLAIGTERRNKSNRDTNRRKRKSIADDFIRRAREMHGNFFDYSLVRYITARRKVKIICPVHGVFEQTPDMHLKSGCRKCADDALPGAYTSKRLSEDPSLARRMAIFYYAYFHRRNEAFYKIGVTLSTIRARLSAFQALGYAYRVVKEIRSTLRRVLVTEQLLIEKHTRKYQYTPRRKDKHGRPAGGHKECFSRPLPPKLLVESGIT